MKSVKFEGKVVTGEGSGRKYLSLPWVKQQIEEKLGFTPYLGTLNLKLTKVSIPRKKFLKEAKQSTICPAEGYCVGLLVKAFVNSLDCAVIIPQIEGYPEDILEIISSVYLRHALHLTDGDPVKIFVHE